MYKVTKLRERLTDCWVYTNFDLLDFKLARWAPRTDLCGTRDLCGMRSETRNRSLRNFRQNPVVFTVFLVYLEELRDFPRKFGRVGMYGSDVIIM